MLIVHSSCTLVFWSQVEVKKAEPRYATASAEAFRAGMPSSGGMNYGGSNFGGKFLSLSLLVAGLSRVMAAPLSDGPVMSIQA